MTIDATKLDAWQRATDEASPEPWRNGSDPSHFDMPEVTDDRTFAYYVRHDKDAAFIATARTAMPQLITMVRQLLSAIGAVAEVAVDEALDEAARQMGGPVQPTFREARGMGIARGQSYAALHVSELPTLEVMRLRSEVERMRARMARSADPTCVTCMWFRETGAGDRCGPCQEDDNHIPSSEAR